MGHSWWHHPIDLPGFDLPGWATDQEGIIRGGPLGSPRVSIPGLVDASHELDKRFFGWAGEQAGETLTEPLNEFLDNLLKEAFTGGDDDGPPWLVLGALALGGVLLLRGRR